MGTLGEILTFVIIGVMLVVFFGGALTFLGRHMEQENKRLIAQCMADGKKEYECVALLRPKDNTVVIPAPVYIPR